MSELKNYRELRQVIVQKLPADFFKRNRALGVLTFIVILLYWGLFYTGILFPVLAIPIALCLGVIAQFLSMASHDILHGSVFKSKNFSIIFCLPISVITLISPSFWKFWHNFHHSSVDRWTTDERPYEMGYETFGYPKIRKIFGFYELFFFKAFHLNYTQIKFLLDRRYKSKEHRSLQVATFFQYLFIVSCKIFLFWMLPFKMWLMLELLPLLIQNFISSVFLVTQHSNKLEQKTTIRTFSVKLPRWLEVYSLNIGYHIEHHLFPNLPSKHLPQIQKILLEEHTHFPQERFLMTEALKTIYKD